MILAARWILPIDRPPIPGGWIEIDGRHVTRVERGAPPAGAHDLGDAVVLPGLVNAHTHLELSWMAGLVPPAPSMSEWIQRLLRVRRSGPPGGAETVNRAAAAAAESMAASGTVLVGDVANTLATPPVLAQTGLGGVVFHELIGFNAAEPAALVRDARARAVDAEQAVRHAAVPIRVTLSAHAPYSVSPALFREIATHGDARPLAVHLGESVEELEFLRTGRGPMRELLDGLGAWTDTWHVPGCDPVEYLRRVGYLAPGLLAVHAVHLRDEALEALRAAEATLVTCPRSNVWVGAGLPRVAHFYAAGVPVAVGTDSLASVGTLNLFDELAELRRVAPDVAAGSILESATRVGAEALGFGASHGTIGPGKQAALISVDLPPGVRDVEEYLVNGVPASAVHRHF
jgi:cytosine/adenosine deaminase-related metal-dependent hydrolase